MIAIAFVVSVSLSSCKDDPVSPTTPIDQKENLSGDIAEDLTISKDVTLSGIVHVLDGATLTIEPGVTITADASELSYLLIEQGAKIMAQGTADAPIVFTANVQEAGAWGGIHICGYAPINSGSIGQSEIGEATYGGDNEEDNSGSLKYVRVEYSGTALDESHEANGISLYGVGNGTTLDYIEIYVGQDDGIEFFGGTVDIRHAVVYGAGDDSFDWTEGWSGRGQYLIVKQMPNVGDRGFEGDNLGSNNAATPYADPMLSNITLIGDGDKDNYGMKLREGTKGYFSNLIVTGFDKRSIQIEHDVTLANLVNDELNVDFAYVNSVVSDAAIKYSASEGSELPANIADHKVENSENVFVQDLTTGVDIAKTYSGGEDMSLKDAWFEPNTIIGAGAEWLSGWARTER